MSSPYDDSPWPKFRANNLNNGQSLKYSQSASSSDWIFETNSPVISSISISSKRDLYFGCDDGNLMSLTSDGSLRWKFPTNGSIWSSPALGSQDGGTVYFGSKDFHMYALTYGGSLKWKFKTNDEVVSSPSLFEDVIVFGSQDFYVYSLYSSNGSLKWKFKTDGPIVASPAIDIYGNIFVNVFAKGLYLLNPFGNSTKTFKPIGTTTSSIHPNCSCALFKGLPVSGYFVGLGYFGNLKSDWTTWHWSEDTSINYAPEKSVFSSPAIDSDGFTYGVSMNGTTVAIDSSQVAVFAKSKWVKRYYDSGTFDMSIAIDASKKVMYMGGNDLFALSTSTGSLIQKWSINSNNQNNSYLNFPHSSPTIGDNGVIYIGSNKGQVMALNLPLSYTKNPSNNSLSAALYTIIIVSILVFLVLIAYLYLRFYYFLLSSTKSDIETIEDGAYMETSNNEQKLHSSSSSAHKSQKGKYFLKGLFSNSADEEQGFSNDDLDLKEIYAEPFANLPSPQNSSPESSYNPNRFISSKANSPHSPHSMKFNSGNSSKSRLGLTMSVMRKADGKFAFNTIAQSITWSEIAIKASTREDAVVGQGSFGTVVRGVYRPNSLQNELDVAIKVFMKSKLLSTDFDMDKVSQDAWREAQLVKEAENVMIRKDCIVKVYGVVEGTMTQQLTSFFKLEEGESAIGIVMRYEGGGSLESLLYEKKGIPLRLLDNIRLLRGIARGLVELHTIGIVHGDLKPANILLSHHNPPEIRLADFGQSVQKLNNRLGESSLLETRSTKGTPIYCAPEMLFNPLSSGFEDTVAKPSRKTDMYAFGIMAWEVVSRSKPFPDFKSEVTLGTKVHQGVRPDINVLSIDTSPGLIDLMTCCWDSDRQKRKSAVECLSILHHNHLVLSSDQFDIFFSHAWKNKPFFSHVFHFLTRKGYRVWYDQFDMGHDMITSMSLGIEKSKVIIVCGSKAYVESAFCMYELRLASGIKPIKPIVVLLSESNIDDWKTDEFYNLCHLKESSPFDLSSFCGVDWADDENGPDLRKMNILNLELENVVSRLDELGCKQSMVKATNVNK